MLVLVDARTGRIIEKHETKTLLDFLKNEWAGWYPYYMDGRLHTTYGPHGSFLGCIDESKYWAEHDPINTSKKLKAPRKTERSGIDARVACDFSLCWGRC